MYGALPAKIFLSTLSLRRATAVNIQSPTAKKNFYPRSPCGERPTMHHLVILCLLFLSTLSLRRATREPTALRTPHHIFLSTLSLRRATLQKSYLLPLQLISIHALLAESDSRSDRATGFPLSFLSTLSLRRATAKVHKTVGHFCAYETNFMGIASSC